MAAVEKGVVHVEIERLDRLLSLVGELVINRTAFVEQLRRARARHGFKEQVLSLIENTERVGRISEQIQAKIIKARLVPVESVFNRFAGLVRNAAEANGKKCLLALEGERTEVDKRTIDELAEPLVHLVRNALDHGIEAPEQREAAGKSPVGSITLSARHEGNRLVVEVRDDGAGIDLAAVRSRALERGLISGAEAETLGERATLDLLFESGFSTASALTAMSGRGVGLDAARRRVDLLGGRLELANNPEAGTTARIELPLTTAIVKALMVRVNDELYALPIGYVQEIIRARRDDVATIEGREVLDRRGEALSLVDLGRVVGLDRAYLEGGFHVVVVGSEGRSLGVVVEAVGERHEIVIKGMGRRLAAVEGVAGAAIGGDGGVVMVLDVAGMLRDVECTQEYAA